MHNLYDEYLCKVLKLFSNEAILEEDILSIQPTEELSLCKLKKLKPHSEFITMGFDISSVFILLTGNCHCIVYSVTGDSIVVDNMIAPHILGVLEIILRIPQFTSSIHTTQTSYILEVPKDIFYHAMLNNVTVAYACTCYFANVAQYYMDMAEIRAFYSTEDTILLYLFNNCYKAVFPYQVSISRRTMSDLLHINLRTLYRYLNKMKDLDYYSIIDGKIRISEKQYRCLEIHCSEVLGAEARPIRIMSTSFQT